MKLKKKKLLVLHINFTINNIIATLTTSKGDTVSWTSVRMCGLTGKKRLTAVALSILSENIAVKLRTIKCETLVVYLKGINKNKKSIFSTFAKKNISIISIKDKTPIPHNGCKAKKIRRT